jgi:hypothetical protein
MELLPSNDGGDTQTHRQAPNNSIVACITEPLPNNENRDTLYRAFAC